MSSHGEQRGGGKLKPQPFQRPFIAPGARSCFSAPGNLPEAVVVAMFVGNAAKKVPPEAAPMEERWLKSTGKTNSFLPPLGPLIKSVYSRVMRLKRRGISDEGQDQMLSAGVQLKVPCVLVGEPCDHS